MRFPLNVFNPFNNADLRWRLSIISNYLLTKFSFQPIPNKPIAKFSYITLVCRADLLMTRLSILSLASVSRRLPSLIIACDDTLTVEDAASAFSFWPGPIKFLKRAHVAEEVKECSGMLAEFARRHIFGYKLACCFMEAKKGRVLYADGDVLWFRDIYLLMEQCITLPLYATTDIAPSYNIALLGKLPEDLGEGLAESPYLNAGVAVYNRAIPGFGDFSRYLQHALAEEPIHRFSEQSLIAAIVKRHGGVIPNDAIAMRSANRFAFQASYRGRQWFARHYVSVPAIRMQFWIDALWLRCRLAYEQAQAV